MVIPTRKLGEAAGFNMPVTVMRDTRLKKLTKNVRNFFKEFAAADLNDVDPSMVQRWLSQHDLETDTLVANYTEPVER